MKRFHQSTCHIQDPKSNNHTTVFGTATAMDSETTKELKMKPDTAVDAMPGDYSTGESEIIYIDPAKEAAAMRRFDMTVFPVSIVFLVLSTLDRNNVSDVHTPRLLQSLTLNQLGNARVFGFDEDIGLKSGQFGNINTLSSVCTILFELPWVLAVKRFGARNSIGAAFVLWSICTLGTAFIQTYGQAIAVRMLLNAAEAGLGQAFAYLFSTIYPREHAGKRIMSTNLAQCISGAFGGLFAYAVQTMGDQKGFAAWRWLFIIEFAITVVICGACLPFIPTSAETAWFLTADEKETMRLKKQRDFVHRGEAKFERKWTKIALTDPFVYLLGIAFFTSSIAINGFGVFLPTIIQGLGFVSLPKGVWLLLIESRFASIQVNYLTIPVYVVGALSLIVQVWFSDKFAKRGIFIISCCVPVAVGYLVCVGTASTGAGYAGMFILVLGELPLCSTGESCTYSG